MAASDDGRQSIVLPRPARKDVADAVDRDGTARLLAPADEQVTGLAIELGERQSAHAALWRSADLGKLHQRIPEPVRVDREGRHGYLRDRSPRTRVPG